MFNNYGYKRWFNDPQRVCKDCCISRCARICNHNEYTRVITNTFIIVVSSFIDSNNSLCNYVS